MIELTKSRLPILMYHSISRYATPEFKQFVVSPLSFADQMAYLYQQAYTPVTVSQFIDMRSQGSSALPMRPIVITFDDGFADFYTHALPVLVQYNFPATLYVTTAFVNGTSRWLERAGESMRQMLTWAQLREINALGIECGAHSHLHPQLDTLPGSIVRAEVVQSKRLLEDHLGRQALSFAYPFGYQNALVRRLVREAGYTSACSVKHTMCSVTSDPFSLPRLMVGADTDRDAFAALITGQDSWSAARLYARTRTPIWQVVRRGSALMKRSLQRNSL